MEHLNGIAFWERSGKNWVTVRIEFLCAGSEFVGGRSVL